MMENPNGDGNERLHLQLPWPVFPPTFLFHRFSAFFPTLMSSQNCQLKTERYGAEGIAF